MKHTTQSDSGMAFDGLGAATIKHTTPQSGNMYSGVQKPNQLINTGRGPTRGNHGTLTDGACHPPAAAVPSLPAQGSIRDNINRGGQVRTPGGTRAFDPKAGQNYTGNADRIRMGRGPTRGNDCS